MLIDLHSVASTTNGVDLDEERVQVGEGHEDVLAIDVSAIFTRECALETKERTGHASSLHRGYINTSLTATE